jgi:hypothetical protein
MLWTITIVAGGIIGFIAMVLLGAVLDRLWGRGHFGAQQTDAQHAAEAEVLARLPGIGPPG